MEHVQHHVLLGFVHRKDERNKKVPEEHNLLKHNVLQLVLHSIVLIVVVQNNQVPVEHSVLQLHVQHHVLHSIVHQ